MRFFPKEPAFYEHFQEMSVCLSDITSIYQEFTNTYKDFESYWLRSKVVEHKADEIAHRVINLLNKSFITPFDREDIYRLIHELDDIIDLLENTIHNIYLFEMSEKKEFLNEFSRLIGKATGALNELLKECFQHQKYTDSIWKLICVIHDLEDEGDMAYERAIRALFTEEKDPLKVMKWKDILETLEFVMDVYQKMSNTIEGIVVKGG